MFKWEHTKAKTTTIQYLWLTTKTYLHTYTHIFSSSNNMKFIMNLAGKENRHFQPVVVNQQ